MWSIYHAPVISVSLFMPKPYCLDYYNFLKYSFKSGNMMLSSLFSFLKIVLAILGSSVVPYKCYDFFLFLWKLPLEF